MMKILKTLLLPLMRNWKACQSCRDGFPTYPRDDKDMRSQVDLIYCELIEGHAGKHRGINSQTGEYWYWAVDRTPNTKNEEIKNGVAYYDVTEYWQEYDAKRKRF